MCESQHRCLGTRCVEIKMGNRTLLWFRSVACVCVCVCVAKSACQTRGLNYMPTHKVLYSESTASVNNLHPDLDLASQEIVTILNETESKPLADVSQRAVFRTA